jgi:hypothetical protein
LLLGTAEVIERRSFLAYGVGMLAASAVAQTAIMEKHQAVVCETGSTKCPNNHETCFTINRPIAVGDGTYQNPEVAALNGKIILECDVCHVAFFKA